MLTAFENRTAYSSATYDHSLSIDKQKEYSLQRAVLVGVGTLGTLLLFNIEPASYFEADTAKQIISPAVKDQRLNTERADLVSVARIRALATYSQGWDGADGRPPTEATVDDAETFAWLLLRDERIATPIVSLSADGEIAFLWALPTFRLDLGFYGDGTYSYYGRSSNGKEFISDEESIEAPLPEEILQLILRNKS
ncbi:MAG: hypothetical protein ACRESZ_10245 [Methylococcales bacterium]